MIYWFSGTGGSKYVAEQLAKATGDRLISIAECIEHADYRHTLAPGEAIGWVFPIYSWGPPPAVVNFIVKHWHIYDYVPGKTYVYMVGVCGDEAALAPQMWRKALGFINGSAAFTVQMPNNYILLPGFDIDSTELQQAKIDASHERINTIAEHITQRRCIDDVVVGSMPWIKSRLIYPLFKHFYMSDKRFAVDRSRCNGCQLCQRTCPAGNIRCDEHTGAPDWLGHCEMCLSCIHRCPQRAIDYGAITRKKGRYFFRPQ